jgi:uncharacterized membrane protein YadS
MTLISSAAPAKSLNDGADARLPFQRWPGRKTREILPGLLLNWVMAGTAVVIRQLPGMATFSPLILSMMIEIALHNIVGTAAWAKQGMTSSLRWLSRIPIFRLELQFTSSQVTEIGGRDLGIIAATVLASFAFTIWFGPVPPGAFAFLFIAGFSLTLIKLME